MMIRIVDGNEGRSITVEITREIKVDGLYKIQPTEAYLGIETGTVRVMFIGSLADLVDYDENMCDQADEFARISLDGMEHDYAMELEHRFHNQPWVVYQYNSEQDRCVLPLEEFVEHTTHY